MASDRVLPAVGQTLVHRNAKTGEVVSAKVIEVDEAKGTVRVRVGEKEYPSLSTAAKAVTGTSTNGWIYWGLKVK